MSVTDILLSSDKEHVAKLDQLAYQTVSMFKESRELGSSLYYKELARLCLSYNSNLSLDEILSILYKDMCRSFQRVEEVGQYLSVRRLQEGDIWASPMFKDLFFAPTKYYISANIFSRDKLISVCMEPVFPTRENLMTGLLDSHVYDCAKVLQTANEFFYGEYVAVGNIAYFPSFVDDLEKMETVFNTFKKDFQRFSTLEDLETLVKGFIIHNHTSTCCVLDRILAIRIFAEICNLLRQINNGYRKWSERALAEELEYTGVDVGDIPDLR